jgi:hypothetical protein
MRGTSARGQLPLRWTDDDVRWDELPAPLRVELRELLRAVLERLATGEAWAEVGHDQ